MKYLKNHLRTCFIHLIKMGFFYMTQLMKFITILQMDRVMNVGVRGVKTIETHMEVGETLKIWSSC